MRLFLAVVSLSLLACGGLGKKGEEDSAEIGVETDDSSATTGDDSGGGGGGGACEGTPTITDWNYECDGGSPESCVFWVEADQHMGEVRVTLTETGDPSSNCGPKGGVNDCGVWEEQHDGFEKVGKADGGGKCSERWELVLQVESRFQNQVDNESTLFGTRVMDQGTVTVLVRVEDVDGAPADCDVAGQDPGYFADQCN